MKLKQRVVRPVATIGFTFMLTLLAANYLPARLSAVLSILSFVLVFIASLIQILRSQRLLLIGLTIGIAFGCSFLHTTFNYRPVLALDGKTANISGTVTNVEEKTITVRLDRKIMNIPIPAKVKIYLEEPCGAAVADHVSLTASFYLPSAQYGTYSPLENAKADGIYLYGSNRDTKVTVVPAKGFHLSATAYRLRETIKSKITEQLPKEDAAILCGMLLGDSSELNDQTYRNFVRTGMLHIFVVSGLHLVIFSQFFIRTLKILHVRRRVRYFVGLAILPFFMAMAGFTPSINRAGLMLILLYSARLFRREPDSLTSIGFAGLLSAFFSPFVVADLSFQLTYLSTLGIILLSGRFSKAISMKLRLKNRALVWAAEMFCVTCAVLIFTVPVTAFHFRGLPVLAPLVGIILTPLFTLILQLGLILNICLISPYLIVISDLLSSVISLLNEMVCAITAFCSSLSFSYLPLGYRYAYFWILLSILLVTIAAFFGRQRYKYRLTALFCALSLILCSGIHATAYHDTVTLAVCTEGKEAAAVIACEDQMLSFGCNKVSLALADQTWHKKIPLIVSDTNLTAIAQYSEYYQIDTLFTNGLVPEDTIRVREVSAPKSCQIGLNIPISLSVYESGSAGEFIYVAEYGNTAVLYGRYTADFEAYFRKGKKNIYILVNDCNSVFQNKPECVIMLNGISKRMKQKNPTVRLLDGSVQGITPLRLHKNGDISVEGAGQWLY